MPNLGMLGKCNLCGWPIIRIGSTIFGSRCINCRSTQIHRAVGLTISSFDFSCKINVYELSSRAALFKFLLNKFNSFYYSEFFDDVPSGANKNGIPCQDVQALKLNDSLFDLVTSTEVFEHVPNDIKGFSEIYRVLRTGGYFIFTVPLTDNPQTVERAFLKYDGSIEYILPAEYHADKIRGKNSVLAFRNYGMDIKERLISVGFTVEIRKINCDETRIFNQYVIVAKKRN